MPLDCTHLTSSHLCLPGAFPVDCLGRNCFGTGYTDPDPGGCDGSRIIKARPGHSRGLSREDKGKKQALKYYLACSHWSAKCLSSLLSRVPCREKKKLSY